MDMQLMEKAFASVAARIDITAIDIALILGSGWSGVVDAFPPSETMAYSEIAGLGPTGVTGHAGRLCVAQVAGRRLLIFQGRRHWYEGHGWTPVGLPVFMAAKAGARTLLLTNAAGGVNPVFAPGDLMLVSDHINAMGVNPLVGPHDSHWGARFPDQSQLYSADLIALFEASAQTLGLSIHKGIYLAVSGPCYETPAEIRMYRALGADAIGMSTVPEAILAGAAGLRVGAISCVTNPAAGVDSTAQLVHDDVLDAGRRAMPRMSKLLMHAISHGDF